MQPFHRAPALAFLFAAAAPLVAPAIASAQPGFGVTITANVAPPPLPAYVQPPIPGADYIWTPGYWAWDDDSRDYYWVPGAWVLAPEPSLLWTPPYWGWSHGGYGFHPGYWGPTVGFYGGVVYGYGYNGGGYEGGYWNRGHFFYNTAVNHINNVHITNVYNHTVINHVNVTNVSYNGGPGGVPARPTPQQMAALNQRRLQPTPMQMQHMRAAAAVPAQFAAANHGRPAIAATPRPAAFSAPGVVSARGAPAVAAGREPARPPEQAVGVGRPQQPTFRRPFDQEARPNAGARFEGYGGARPAQTTSAYPNVDVHRPQAAPAYQPPPPAPRHQPAYHQPAYHQPADRRPAYRPPAYHPPAHHPPPPKPAPRAPEHPHEDHKARR